MDFLYRLRSVLKKYFDLINNDKLKTNLLNALPYWICAFIVGVVSVAYAKMFAFAESKAHLLFHHASWAFLLVTPLTLVLSCWVIWKFAPYAKGSGIPQVSAAIWLATPKHNDKVNLLLSVRVMLVKIFTSLLVALGGVVIGREGPTIQVSASIFKRVNDILPPWYPKISKKNMIVTGAAAGLAAAFNTPLGGIVFAIEELTKTHFSFFKSALLTGVIISGLTAQALLGPYLYLGYPQLNNFSYQIILIIIPLALITAVVGSGMGRALLYLFGRKAKLTRSQQLFLYPAVVGLILALVAIFIDKRVLGSGNDIIVNSLFSSDKYLEWYVPILRALGPVLSFSTGTAGGIFAPSLSTGASIGAVFADWFNLSSTETNLVIMCGMTGCLTSITRSPFTSSILILEMTDSHNVIFFIMLSALISNLVASLFGKHSFYDYMKYQYIQEIVGDKKENEDTSESGNGKSDQIDTLKS